MACLLGKFLCALMIGHSGAATLEPPSIENIQAAFDREATTNDGKHDKDIKITGLECLSDSPPKYSCQVNFVRSEQNSGQVYLDVALVEWREDGNWKLLKGLCRRLL